MAISGICHVDRVMVRRRRIGAAGVTLIELMVILALLALMGAMAVPEIERVFGSLRFRLNRDDIERQLAALQQQAYLDSRNYLLMSMPTLNVQEVNEQRQQLIRYDALLAPIKLPQGFALEIDRPILFRRNGLCDGGRVQVQVAKFAYVYVMNGPRCLPREP